MNLNSNQISFFKEKGYLLLNQFIKEEIINDLVKENEFICKNVNKGSWPFLNVYNDYIHFSGIINLFLGFNYPKYKNKIIGAVQLVGSLFLILAPIFFMIAFFNEPILPNLQRPFTRKAIYLIFSATLLFLISWYFPVKNKKI